MFHLGGFVQRGDLIGNAEADRIVGVEIAGYLAPIRCVDEDDQRRSVAGIDFDRDRAGAVGCGDIAVPGCVPVTHMPEFEPASRADPESVEPGRTGGIHAEILLYLRKQRPNSII